MAVAILESLNHHFPAPSFIPLDLELFRCQKLDKQCIKIQESELLLSKTTGFKNTD